MPTSRLLAFGQFRLDPAEQVLKKNDQRLSLRPKSFRVLNHLVRNAGRLVTKEELLSDVWRGSFVGDGVIKSSITEIRRVLGDKPEAPQFIQTVSRRGYRFVGPVLLGNLPVPRTSFVGREGEIQAVERLLKSQRLITLHGPPGTGKTRLAIRIASDLLPEMPHGAWWIDIAVASDATRLERAVAGVWDLHDREELSLSDSLAAALKERALLLLFDNCEHLLEACASLADRLLSSCPNLKILATSREPLGVTGETLWSVSTLSVSVPDLSARPDEPTESEAVMLFVERAKTACPSFAISDDNRQVIATICEKLDGLPLAIELVAACVRALTPDEIAAHLGEVLTLPGQGSEVDLRRHRTLTAALDWSADLLSSKERLLFPQLSVFAGGFSLAAVEAVCSGPDLEATALLDLMVRLVDHSLVVVSDQSAGETRYRLLFAIRQYARGRLSTELSADLARRHAEFFAQIAEKHGPAIHDAKGHGHASFARLNQNAENLHMALVWAKNTQGGQEIGLRISAALWHYWLRRGQWRDGLVWLREILNRTAGLPTRLKAEALCGVGAILNGQRDFEHSRPYLAESVALWRTTDDLTGLARALYRLATAMAGLGELEGGRRVVEESVRLLRHGASSWDLGLALKYSGDLEKSQECPTEAAKLYEESAAHLRAIPSPWLVSLALGELATLEVSEERYERAMAHWQEILTLLRPLEDTWFVSGAVKGVGQVLCTRGDYPRAARLFGAADGLQETVDGGTAELWPANAERFADEVRAALGEAAFNKHRAEGRRLSREESIALALWVPEPADEKSEIV